LGKAAGVGETAEENPTLFRLVLVSDSHVRLETDDPQNLFPSDQYANDKNRYVVEQINNVSPDLVIHLGDIPHTIPSSENHDQAMRNAHAIYKNGIRSDLYVVPGNHDIGNKPNAFTSSPIMEEGIHEVFERYWGATYSSFDYEDCHFLLLSSSVLNSGLPLEVEQRLWMLDDLRRNRETGRRVFWCMHHPPFINHPSEIEHYDNIGEPGRSWLLSLLREYEVEAVFCGHAHNFFYNLYGNTDLYSLPSITFVRPDFSAMFHVSPADDENGRNDVNKLGFSLLDIRKRGHRLSTIRTYGLTEEREDTVVSQPRSLAMPAQTEVTSGVGTTLRHTWAKTTYMPCDSLDEFARKPIRNDYLLQALGELNIKKLRVPIGDLGDEETLDRIRVLKRLGYEFTIFSIGVPALEVKDVILKNEGVIDAWEVTIPRKQMGEAVRVLREVKRRTGIAVFLSTLDTLTDQKVDEDYVFSHFPTHGFKLREHELLRTFVDQAEAAQALDGFVFSVNAEMEIFESIQRVEDMVAQLRMRGVVHLNMPRRTEATPFIDDDEIARVVGETLISSLAVENVEIFMDTLVDHDRGYFPRHGLIDRRYNPRLAFHVFRHLHRAVCGEVETLGIREIGTDPSMRAFEVRSPDFRCALILPEGGQRSVELAFDTDLAVDESDLEAMDLHTGRMRVAQVRVLNTRKIVFDTGAGSSAPVLLVLG
jgi:predicted phosphodiesterase